MKPDYGVRLMQDGVSADVDLFFYDFAVFDITVVGRRQYSAFAEYQQGGEWYAMSLDFGERHLQEILAMANHELRNRVRTQLGRDPATPRSIDLGEPIWVNVRARLGRPQRNRNELYVPLVCQEVLGGPRAPSPDRAPQVWLVTVPKTMVQAGDLAQALREIRHRLETTRDPREVRHRLTFRFSGYKDDSRELWEIPEVRKFVAALDEQCPFWFYLVELESDCLKVLAFCLCRVSTVRPGVTAVHQADWAAFLERHFGAMNQLLEHWSLGDDENRRVSEEVIAYFERAQTAR